MAITPFGHINQDTEVSLISIVGGGLEVGVLTHGAAIRSLDFDAGNGLQPRVLGLNTLADYIAHSPSMGIVAGRYANRIGGARFPLDGGEVVLAPNERGNQLHGGPEGFGKRVWSIVDHGADHVTLSLRSSDGDQGYPGTVDVLCRYAITGQGVLTIELTAVTDAPTVINLATHSYFNLDGSDTILDHLLSIPADAYTPVDAELIPTGEIRAVAGTAFDFRTPRAVTLVEDGKRVGYDHNFVVAREKSPAPRRMATVFGPKSSTELQIFSTEPGVQFYDGAYLDCPVPGLGRPRIGPNAGLCLEPQIFPDTPNKPQFGDATLRPGETYRQVTEYRFRRL